MSAIRGKAFYLISRSQARPKSDKKVYSQLCVCQIRFTLTNTNRVMPIAKRQMNPTPQIGIPPFMVVVTGCAEDVITTAAEVDVT